jgi:hypothetical protein
MTGVKYKRGPIPVFYRLGDIKQPDGYVYNLFVFTGDAGNYYALFRSKSRKIPIQAFDYMTYESALELIQDPNFVKTDYCQEFLATQPPKPAKEQWDLKTIFREELL